MRRLAIVSLHEGQAWPPTLPYRVVGRQDHLVKIEGEDLPPTEEGGRVHQFVTLGDLYAYRRVARLLRG